MDNEDKYKAMKEYILKNFSTTQNIHDRLHTQDIINILGNNNFLFSTAKISQNFKSLNLGEHRKQCNINKKIQSGYYYLKYTGEN